jgi:hypothetical protein
MRNSLRSLILPLAMAMAVPLAQGIAWSQSGGARAARDREFAAGADVDLLQDVTPAPLRGVADNPSRVSPEPESLAMRAARVGDSRSADTAAPPCISPPRAPE